ncbi:MAG: hypothetical protein RQ741_00670 [Wenzhouxiangellaceae bacterium]|nr:hypothetical protein [Wenzhouxiangellaceae bacterium]
MNATIDAVEELMAEDLAAAAPDGLEPLLEAIRKRCGPALRAVVLYGSCRRSADIHDGLVDLMAVVSAYRPVHDSAVAAALNRLLPPNVYYLETGDGRQRLRCKYIIISEAAFKARTHAGLDGYFWARFTQPCRRIWAADPSAERMLASCRARAAARFARSALRLGAGRLDGETFWIRAMRASYGCELRPEPPGAAQRLIERDSDFWNALSARLLPRLDEVQARDGLYDITLRRGQALAGKIEWRARGIWSKTRNILRLLKAAGTFANGIDYLSWKIERHSGVRIEPTERMRRHPRLAAWGLLFRLLKKKAL